MRNNHATKIEKIIKLLEELPYFTIDDVLSIENNKTYLKILFSRYEGRKKLIRLKKGIYTTSRYINNIQKSRRYSSYLEALSVILYQPSYLSLEYVLYQHNILTEIPTKFTSITLNKTNTFSNSLGTYIYHNIKKELFCGFETVKDDDFVIYKATKSKALFDFLYLRKNLLTDERAILELRLNLNDFGSKNFKEFKRYVEKEGSTKMKFIFNFFIKER